jgi:Family of unknown function (DUF6183)
VKGRRAIDVEAFARGLRGSRNWQQERAQVAEAIAERPSRAIDLAAALDADLDAHGFDLAVHAIRGSLLDVVGGLVHHDATRVAVHLASNPGMPKPWAPDPGYRRSRGAMQIAGTRPPAEAWSVLADPSGLRRRDPEFAVLLLHELVVRGAQVPSAAGWIVDWARATAHPLSQLPAQLLAVENGLPGWLPRYGRSAGGLSWEVPNPTPEPPVALGQLLQGVGAVVPVDRDRIGATFRDWVDHSNGRVEIAGYAPGSGFPVDLPEPRLRADCRASAISPAAAIELLFSAAVGSGAYSHGPGGGFSRLRMWEAVSGIVDLAWPSDIHRLAEATETASWIMVEPDPAWFDEVAWDVWLIAEVAGRVVVAAATDTD